MNTSGVNCKVKLVQDGDVVEMRRFALEDTSFASDVELFKDKLRAVFPQLRRAFFRLTWTDADGDAITIANDDDLITAMMEMNGVKQMEVHLASDGGEPDVPEAEDGGDAFAPQPPAPFAVITCDVCNNQIMRYRYKCLQCPDYDLCLACEQAGNHSHHVMMRLADLQMPRCLPRIMGHMTRTARKAAHRAAKEAHRTARDTLRAVHQAASGRCPGRPAGCPRPATAPQTGATAGGCPVTNTAAMFDIANDIMGRVLGGLAAPPPQNAGPTPTPQQNPSSGQGEQPQPEPFAPEVIGNVLRNIFSAINAANLPQGATPAASGAATPVPTTAAAPAQSPDVQVVPPPAPVVTKSAVPQFNLVAPSSTGASVPMDVEPQPTGIYPNIASMASQTPTAPSMTTSNVDPGWTFVSQQPMMTPPQAAAMAAEQRQRTDTEESIYAEQLSQLRRMGFSESVDLVGLLRRYQGNIGMVVNHLFEGHTK